MTSKSEDLRIVPEGSEEDSSARDRELDAFLQDEDLMELMRWLNSMRSVDTWLRDTISGYLERKGSAAIPALLHALDAGTYTYEVRFLALRTLGRLEEPRAVEGLIKALDDSSPTTRREAATALGNIGDKRAVPVLVDALSTFFGRTRNEPILLNPTIVKLCAEVRREAATALGKIGDDAAIAALQEAYDDPNQQVRSEVSKSLKMLGCPFISKWEKVLELAQPSFRKPGTSS